jgi:hypothetical protein
MITTVENHTALKVSSRYWLFVSGGPSAFAPRSCLSVACRVQFRRRRLMPAVGADAAAGKAAAARILTIPASTISQLGLHPSHGKKRPANSHNENARPEVDAANRCGRFPAAPCERPGVRAHSRHHATTSKCAETRRHPAAMSIAAAFGWPPTCAYADMNRLKSNEAIPRREFVPRDPCRTNQL